MGIMKNSYPYIDRELSWMDFNERVLCQTNLKKNPLIERLKFLGITHSNLDEFLSVRFSDVYSKYINKYELPDDIGNTNYKKKYKKLLERVHQFKEEQCSVFNKLEKQLNKENIEFVSVSKLDKKERKNIDKYFNKSILPVLSPILYSNRKELPLFKDNEINFLIHIKDGKKLLAFLPIPSILDRIVSIDKKRYVFIEDIIKENLNKIFQNVKIKRVSLFKVAKEYLDIPIHDKKRSIVDSVKDIMSKREHGRIIFIDTYQSDKKMNKTLCKIFSVPKAHIFKSSTRIGLRCLIGKPIKKSELEFAPSSSVYPTELTGIRSIFDYLDNNDIILHHPYQSYDVVLDFIREAANDDKVISIKQTLYRVSSTDSPIIKSLCRAANNGKRVTVMLELLARFDESQNLKLVDKLKAAGVSIVYSLEHLKTHCKMCLVTKRTKKGIQQYSYTATGNFNEKTARQYTDLSMFTSNKKFGDDLNTVFNMLTGYSKPEKLDKLYCAPYSLRKKLYKLIDNEIKSKDGHIKIKVNSICDLGIMNKLNEAADVGVKIDILCRGICSIIPRKNIKVYSIIGKHLEHSRIYSFKNGGKWKRFISSADLLTRNLDKRVELLIPVKDKSCNKKIGKIFDHIFEKDTANKFEMNSKGEYIYLDGKYDTQK